MTWVLGLTGGIASGKTRVANCFAELGAHLVDADVIARIQVARGTQTLDIIAQHFGDTILVAGELNRAELRRRIFANPSDKTWLEELLHPLIRAAIIKSLSASDTNSTCSTHSNSDSSSAPYTILVAPLLFENALDQLTQRTLVVDASEDQQIKRAVSRDGSLKQTVEAIVTAQMPRQERLIRADDILDNSGPWINTQQAIAILHQHYLQLAKNHDPNNAINPLPHL